MKKIRARAAVVIAAIVSGVAVFAATPAHASTCMTSAQFGVCFPANGQTYQDNNNVWNAGAAASWSQTMTAAASTQFSVAANVNAMDGTSVISYPEAALTYLEPRPLSQWSEIVGQWHAGLPSPHSGDRYEMAYDLWLDAGPGHGKEVMIWTQNNGQIPGGNNIGPWVDPMFGNVYDVWVNSTTVWFVCLVGSHTGSVDIKAVLQHAIKGNPAWAGDPGYNYQFDYGPEIVTTTGHKEIFYLYGLNYIMK